MRTMVLACVSLSLVLAATAACKDPSGTSQPAVVSSSKTALVNIGEPLVVGNPPPDLVAKAHDGSDVHLSALKGKPVLVYFYPKDETSGCTAEAEGFRDNWSELQKTGAVVIGISGDSIESHRSFAENHKLPFLLVSDPEGRIAAHYGVPFRVGFASRQSFLVGPDGNVAKVYRTVEAAAHPKQVAADIAALGAKAP